MKKLFTLITAIAFGFGTLVAQEAQVKTPAEGYGTYVGLNNKPTKNKSDLDLAKQLEGMLMVNGVYGMPGGTVDLPFSLNLTNGDFEYADFISITFPAGFTINSVSNDDVFGPSFDDPDGADGDPEPFNGIDGQTVSWGDDDNSWGGITPGNEYTFTINVTVGDGVTGEQTLDYSISGDGFGANPGGIDASVTIVDMFSVGLPLDFELPVESYNFLGFEGADSAIEPNPDQSGVNTSATVMRSIKTEGAAFFAGTFVDLDETIDLSASQVINIDTWSPTADIPVRIALESAGGGNQVVVDVNTTVAGEWETLSADFSGVYDPNVDYGRIVVFFNFVVDLPGDGSTYYFDNVEVAPLPTILEIVAGSDVHNTLETAVVAAGLDGVLGDPDGDFTVFAPTDAAFDALPDGVLDALLDDPNGALTNVLLHHVVVGSAFSGDLMDGMEIVTAQGEVVEVSIVGSDVFIISGDVTAQVILPDLAASNGVVHVIDAVLVPEFCTLFDGGPYTNFGVAPAPVDGICPFNLITGFQAWASEAYIITEFVEGSTYTFGLSGGDVGAWDPYFLVIDAETGEVVASETEGFSITWTSPADGDYLVMIGEEGFCADGSPNLGTDGGFPYITCESDVTVVDIIVASEDHNTLEAAVIAAGLDDDLSGEGPFTVFAPTDAAFDALPDGLLDDLLADPEGLLTDVLLHHVVGGLAFSSDLSDGQVIETLLGDDITIGIDGETVTVTSSLGSVATVTVANIVASNGVVHVINAVLAPQVLSVEELSSVSEFRMFPNPANNDLNVEIQMTESNDLTIDVVNILGQVVKSYDFGARSAGFNREVLDVNDLPEGMYILNITVGNDQATTKLQIAR